VSPPLCSASCQRLLPAADHDPAARWRLRCRRPCRRPRAPRVFACCRPCLIPRPASVCTLPVSAHSLHDLLGLAPPPRSSVALPACVVGVSHPPPLVVGGAARQARASAGDLLQHPLMRSCSPQVPRFPWPAPPLPRAACRLPQPFLHATLLHLAIRRHTVAGPCAEGAERSRRASTERSCVCAMGTGTGAHSAAGDAAPQGQEVGHLLAPRQVGGRRRPGRSSARASQRLRAARPLVPGVWCRCCHRRRSVPPPFLARTGALTSSALICL